MHCYVTKHQENDWHKGTLNESCTMPLSLKSDNHKAECGRQVSYANVQSHKTARQGLLNQNTPDCQLFCSQSKYQLAGQQQTVTKPAVAASADAASETPLCRHQTITKGAYAAMLAYQ